LEVGVALRCLARQPMKIRKCDHALTRCTSDMHLGLQHRERHAHVGWVRGDAGITAAQDRVHAIVAVDGGAAAARLEKSFCLIMQALELREEKRLTPSWR